MTAPPADKALHQTVNISHYVTLSLLFDLIYLFKHKVLYLNDHFHYLNVICNLLFNYTAQKLF